MKTAHFGLRPTLYELEYHPLVALLLFMDQIWCYPCLFLATPFASLPVWECDWPEVEHCIGIGIL